MDLSIFQSGQSYLSFFGKNKKKELTESKTVQTMIMVGIDHKGRYCTKYKASQVYYTVKLAMGCSKINTGQFCNTNSVKSEKNIFIYENQAFFIVQLNQQK
jgi:hypothetical protein